MAMVIILVVLVFILRRFLCRKAFNNPDAEVSQAISESLINGTFTDFIWRQRGQMVYGAGVIPWYRAHWLHFMFI